MKSIVQWVLFVPVALISIVLALIAVFAEPILTEVLSMGTSGVIEIVIYSVLALFVACFLVSLFDKKTSPLHLLRKNYFCGVTAIGSAFALAADVALKVTDIFSPSKSGNTGFFSILVLLFSVASTVALLFVALNHINGENTPKNLSILYLSLPLWCAANLLYEFMAHTATHVSAIDTLDLLAYVFLAMFFIYTMMIHSLLPAKNAVKSATMFGFPAGVLSVVNSIILFGEALSEKDAEIFDYIPAITFGFIGLYVIGFLVELSFFAKSTEEQLIIVDESETKDSDDLQEETAEESDETASDESATTIELDLCDDNEGEQEESDDDAQIQESALRDIFFTAKQRDGALETDDEEITEGESMIIEGEIEVVEPAKKAPVGAPKGVTVREAVMLEDDFILSLDAKDVDASVKTVGTATAAVAATDDSNVTSKVEDSDIADKRSKNNDNAKTKEIESEAELKEDTLKLNLAESENNIEPEIAEEIEEDSLTTKAVNIERLSEAENADSEEKEILSVKIEANDEVDTNVNDEDDNVDGIDKARLSEIDRLISSIKNEDSRFHDLEDQE